MTFNEFTFICENNAVLPSIALENPRVRNVLERSRKGGHGQEYDVWLQLELSTILQQEF